MHPNPCVPTPHGEEVACCPSVIETPPHDQPYIIVMRNRCHTSLGGSHDELWGRDGGGTTPTLECSYEKKEGRAVVRGEEEGQTTATMSRRGGEQVVAMIVESESQMKGEGV